MCRACVCEFFVLSDIYRLRDIVLPNCVCILYYDTPPYVIIVPPPFNSINAVILAILEAESSGICTTYCTGLIGRDPIYPVQYV